MWDASLFLYLEIATMKKIYVCSLVFSSNCYYTGKQKVICPYFTVSWLVWGLPGVWVFLKLILLKDNWVQVQQFP